MFECSKSIARRLSAPGFTTHYFRGHGLDVGSGPDPLGRFGSLFPLIQSVRSFDTENGDAQFLESIPDNQYDFLHSSHCLEHMRDPVVALRNWIRVVRPGGYLVILVPDEDLYEQGAWPSLFNSDHKCTFTILKSTSWSPVSVNIVDLLKEVAPLARILKVELLHQTYVPGMPRTDQTLTPVTESAIEMILQKAPSIAT